ncbi:MAG: transposase [Clostridia bacterium]|nr:transposase [Clostridia bacterium]
MIFNELVVEIPRQKRITQYGSHGKPYVYEILKRKGKDNPKDVVACVGVSIDEKNMHPNDKYFELHPEMIHLIPQENADKLVFDSQIFLGASMLIRSAARNTGLLNFLDQRFPGRSEMILTLLEYYMVEKESAAQLYKYYLFNHFTKLNYIPSEKEISHLLNNILSHETIQHFLTDWMRMNITSNSNVHVDIDLDSTNFNIGSKDLSSAERGKPKDDEGLPQINVAYFLDRKTGLPVYYDIYYGSIIDMEHCKTAVEKVKAANPDANISFIMDRGYFYKKNLDYMWENGYSFLCMGRDGVRLDNLIKEYPVNDISKAVNRVHAGIYGVKLKGKAFETDGKEYHLYLYYNNAKVAESLPQMQDYFEYCAKSLVGKRDRNYSIRNTYGKYVKLILDEHDVILSAEPNYEYLDYYRDTCGYFWIVSTEDLSAEEALLCYRHRDSVEKVFKGIKTDSDLNKMYAQTDSAFEAKNFLAFLTAVIRADITVKLRPFFFQYSSETTQTVLKELEKIKAERIGNSYLLRCPLTARQKHILSFYELDSKSVSEYIRDINLAKDVADK